MKIFYLYLFFSLLYCMLPAAEKKVITAKFQDINKPLTVNLEIQNNQVIFVKPLVKMQIDLADQTKAINIIEQFKAYPFEENGQTVTITMPSENKFLEVFFLLKNKTNLKFIIVTAIKDIDTNDGEIQFAGVTYPIGNYPLIPSSGKTNYFKDKYEPPKYFFIWNSLFEDRPISKSMKYCDLVIKPDAEKPNLPRPPRSTKVFTLSYETILNFEKIVEKARLKTSFKKVSILSYYRTPAYNHSIGGSAFSRHIYGDGIDWYIDENPENEEMDDLNKDGKMNPEDALSFVQAIIELVSNREIEPCGTGVYFTKKGASLHYDSRGHLARWGESENWWPDKSLTPWLKEIEDKVKEFDKAKSK